MDKTNRYIKDNWPSMLEKYSLKKDENGKPLNEFNISDYHKILCSDFPEFIKEYSLVPSMQRLKGIGLLCGTDWTPLYKNRFRYSRFDHSVGVALIVWNFTKDKIQTLAGLFHDISTASFSHVQEFRKGDALTQSESESRTKQIIENDEKLCALLKRDGIKIQDVCDYHIYPIADNEVPQLSADRLEYMFPSGAALHGNWTINEIKNVYENISVLTNESGKDELGFKSLESAELYCEKFCETGHILQLNENKLTMQLLAEIIRRGIFLGIITESDCMNLDEEQLLCKFRVFCTNGEMFGFYDKQSADFQKYFNTFCNMKEIVHSDEKPFDDKKGFSVNLKVKQRYINPLVVCEDGKARRLSDVSEKAKEVIRDFLDYEDTKWGGVAFIE